MLAAERRWPRIFTFKEFEAYHRGGPNEYAWSNLVIRRLDPRAHRRSWHLSWSHAEQRLAGRVDADDLARRHPDFMPELLRRLKAWQPPQP
ncbi:MAG: hypothetical protein WA728_19035 [Xanthobacteraceae bacterium]